MDPAEDLYQFPPPVKPTNPWVAVAIAAMFILAGAGAHWLARVVSGY